MLNLIESNLKHILISFLLLFPISVSSSFNKNLTPSHNWLLPLDISSRKDFNSIHWEKDARFLAGRSEGHLHTGVDIMNPSGGHGEIVFSAAAGKVVSIYAVEPHRAVMIQHLLPTGETVYSVYIHITNVMVDIGDVVTGDTEIANLMNRSQLDKYGWEFNHLHFEILKKPRVHEANGKFLSFSTRCKTKKEVFKHFYNPKSFLQKMWSTEEVYLKK